MYTTRATDIFMLICILLLVGWFIVRSVLKDKNLNDSPIEEDVLDFDDDATE